MANYARFKYVKIAVKDRIATLTLNRPEVLNAINSQMEGEVIDAFRDLSRDAGVAAIVVTGAGRGFCSGGDMKWMAEGGIGRNPMQAEAAGNLLYAMLGCPQPIIAAVNGAAVGLGSTIALFCDVVVASENARFGDTHVRAGIVAGDGGAIIWPLLVGLNKAKELLMLGSIIDAKEAHRIGVVQRLVAQDKLLDEATGLARELANGPLLAIRWTKQALNKILWERTVQLSEYGCALEMLSGQHPDQQEATHAFVEKRTPKYKPTLF